MEKQRACQEDVNHRNLGGAIVADIRRIKHASANIYDGFTYP